MNSLLNGYIQKNPGTYRGEKSSIFTGLDKIPPNYDWINGSIVDGIRESFLDRFAWDKPPGYKIYTETEVKVCEKINKSVLSHITFYLEADDHKSIDFNGEMIIFTGQSDKT